MTTADISAPTLSEPQHAARAKGACGVESPIGVVLLCGPAGVGKTLVLDTLARAFETRGRTARRETVIDWLSRGGDLPAVVLADDAHLASDGELATLLGRCRRGRPAAVVLAGQGRLFSLVARDTRVEQAVGIRVSLLPGTAADTRALLNRVLASPVVLLDEAAGNAIHELAGGMPGAVVRLAELAGVLASTRPDGRLAADDIEAVHRRIAPQAA